MKRAHRKREVATAREKPDRRARRRAEIKERLYQAALALFMSRGIRATTVQDITEAADVGKGTFFNYFPTKEHVLTVFYERQLLRTEAALQAAHEGRESMRTILCRLSQASSQEPSRSPAMVRSFLLAILANPEVGDIVMPLLELRMKRGEELYAIAQERGVVRGDLHPSVLARVQLELAFGTSLFWALQPETPLNQLLEANIDLFWLSSASGGATSRTTRLKKRADGSHGDAREPSGLPRTGRS